MKEVDRITTEMAALAKANDYSDLPAFRTRIETDPKYRAEAIIEDFRKYIAAMSPILLSSSISCPRPPRAWPPSACRLLTPD